MHVRVVAPSCSAASLAPELITTSEAILVEAGHRVTWSEHADEVDRLGSSPVIGRVADLHAAFADPSVDAILAVRGGFSSNQLLPLLDWDLVRSSRAVLCGFSDITALCGAILAATGRWSVLGPVLSSFGTAHDPGAMMAAFEQAVAGQRPPVLEAPATWSDSWAGDVEARPASWSVRVPGRAEGPVVGGNLSTLDLLHGTRFVPPLAGSIVVIEEDSTCDAVTFDRLLGSLCQQPGFDEVKGMVVGRLQPSGPMVADDLAFILGQHAAIAHLPTIVDIDVSHTDPVLPIRYGWPYVLEADPSHPRLVPGDLTP